MVKLKIKELKKAIVIKEVKKGDSSTLEESVNTDISSDSSTGFSSSGSKSIQKITEIKQQEIPDSLVQTERRQEGATNERVYGTETSTEKLARDYRVSSYVPRTAPAAEPSQHIPQARVIMPSEINMVGSTQRLMRTQQINMDPTEDQLSSPRMGEKYDITEPRRRRHPL